MIAGCGHTIDFPFPSRNVICKPCFEAQGFTYNRNTYSDIDRGARTSARSGSGTALRGAQTTDERKRAIANILIPVIYGPRSFNNPERGMERAAALATVRERFNVGRATALKYAKEFRTAA